MSREPVGEPKLMIVDGESGWYVEDKNNEFCRLAGPFTSKSEANSQRVRLDRFYRANWKTWVLC